MELKFKTKLFLCKKSILKFIMRTFILLFCTTVFSFTSGNVFSQNTQVTIDADKIVTVDEVFKIIIQQTDYTIVYQASLFKNFPKVELKKGVIRMDKLINKSIKDGHLNVILTEDNTIIIKEAKTQQQIQIHGKVTTQSGLPIPNVTVLLKGTMYGASTDFYGNYNITVFDPENVLIFSALGYETQEIVVGDQNNINIVLKEDVSELEEVTINTGYQKIRPEQSTGSVSTLRARDYDSRINTTDFLTGIQNKIPGLLINNDVQFEGNNLFQIRGISTINGDKKPLIVVDGYPTDLSLDMINPNDIESVTVLRDAAAAAIYGVRSSNGVIIIERKKAKIGKLQVSFRTNTSITPKENFSKYRWDDNASSIYIDSYLATNGAGITSSLWNDLQGPFGYAYTYLSEAPGIIVAKREAGIITAEEATQQLNELRTYDNAKDYGRLFLRPAVTQTYNVDVSGGNETARYYITANYIDSDASQIKNDNNRFQLSSRTTLNLSKRLSVDLNTDFQQSRSHMAPIPNLNSINTFERFQDEQGNPLPLFNGSKVSPLYNERIMGLGLYDNLYYPLVDVNEINTTNNTINYRISTNFRYNIGKGFKLSFGGVYENSRNDMKYLATEESSVTRQYINYYTTQGTDGLDFNVPRGDFLKRENSSKVGYTLRAQLDYNKQINEEHAFNLILGSEVRSIVTQSDKSAYFGYNDQTLSHQAVDNNLFTGYFYSPYTPLNASLSFNDLYDPAYNEDRYFSLYSNVVYTFKKKYSLTGSMRIDQSNLFGTDPKYRYKPLWSVGAAWNIDKEGFMQGVNWANTLKLRMAYGFNGTVAKNSLPQIIASDGLNNLDNTIPILSLLSPANKKLRWEQTRNINMGLDFGLFKNINGSIDYYIKESTDLLAVNQTDPSTGVESALINQASIRNKGLEVSLSADWITRSNFNWNTGLVFSHNTSEVFEVYNDNSSATSIIGNSDYLEGYPVGAMFSFKYAGVNEQGGALIYDREGNRVPFYGAEGIEDLILEGSSIPVINLGLSNRVDIGKFYVYAMVNYYGDFKVRTPVPSPLSVRPFEGAGNYWKTPGDEADLNILPSLQTRYDDYYIATSDQYTSNGAYLTLGDLTAAYNITGSKLEKAGISNVEIRFQASNVYTVGFNKNNFSPATGSYAKSYVTPTYTIGLNINF